MLLFLLVVKGIFEPSPGESELLSKTTCCKFQVSESTHPDSRSTKAFSAVSNKGWSTLPLRDGSFPHSPVERSSKFLMLISCYIPIGLFDTPPFLWIKSPLYPTSHSMVFEVYCSNQQLFCRAMSPCCIVQRALWKCPWSCSMIALPQKNFTLGFVQHITR